MTSSVFDACPLSINEHNELYLFSSSSNDDDIFDEDLGSVSKHTEFRDGDEEFTVERTHTKTTEKITSNRKSRVSRRVEPGAREDSDAKV